MAGQGKGRRGAAGQQYAIVVGLVAIAAILAVTSTGANIKQLFVKTGNTLNAVTNQANATTGATGGGGGANPGGPWAFTNCTQTGASGPTQTQCNSAYGSGNTLNGAVTVAAGIQQWVVPASGTYTIRAIGAKGADSGAGASGGRGASMQGNCALTGGETLSILVGQMGSPGYVGNANGENGGGGGSFVARSGSTPLVVAGGGGGAVGSYNTCSLGQTTADAVTGTSGVGMNCSGNIAGGSNGDGGLTNGNSLIGGGGGGFSSDGANSASGHCASVAHYGKAFINGGAGGDGSGACYTPKPHGGFGGGGAGALAGAGGGGGYSGGSVAGQWNAYIPPGGGGGSFMASGCGAASNAIQAGTGHGSVLITYFGP